MPKEIITYRVLNIKPDKVNKGRLKMSSMINVPAFDTIFDQGDNEVKPIKYVAQVRMTTDREGKPHNIEIPGDIFFERDNQGMIHIRPENKRDLALYQYLEICNFNKSNPNRDEKVVPIFERIDKRQDAKKDFEKSVQANEAIALALNMPYEELKTFAEEMKVDTKRDAYEVRMSMKVMAEKNPTLFISKSKVELGTTLSAQINEAVERKLFSWNDKDRKWQWLPNKILILAVEPGKDETEALISYFTETEKGQTTWKKILDKFKK